jgi:hypothetical protein
MGLERLHRERIADLLSQNMQAVAEWFSEQPDERFLFAPPGKWTAGQHLDHLIRSTRPILLALRLPRIVPLLMFGKARRASETNEAVIAQYTKVLEEGGKASGPYVPPDVKGEDKARLLRQYLSLEAKLARAVTRYPEPALDTHVLPHPLLGKLTIREILYFTAYHNAHHLDTLKRFY